ncbi:hypothetical protein FIBSPDRAFT_865279 [Athelia psychrophila]|uniref:Uncharacterized protein n=1 Tax=Athelia psychrophila TaxID=1759441 RepID=A0A166FSR7_9AGAM|nr:hypothetical protein FIBSPDRAFT_865279 [Fibularhizoctonia sp. CBS 109695]
MPYTEPTSLAGRPFVIVGAGTLSRRIAPMWLTCGETVRLFDTSTVTLEVWAWHLQHPVPASCALVARSWVWSSRCHRFRTLRFVYPRRRQQLKGLLGLIRSPLCTIHDHVFEIDI